MISAHRVTFSAGIWTEWESQRKNFRPSLSKAGVPNSQATRDGWEWSRLQRIVPCSAAPRMGGRRDTRVPIDQRESSNSKARCWGTSRVELACSHGHRKIRDGMVTARSDRAEPPYSRQGAEADGLDMEAAAAPRGAIALRMGLDDRSQQFQAWPHSIPPVDKSVTEGGPVHFAFAAHTKRGQRALDCSLSKLAPNLA